MTTANHELRTRAESLVRAIRNNPEILVAVTPPRDTTAQLKNKPQGKVHNGKPNFHRQIADYSAVELLLDLEEAIKWDDYEEIAQFYYSLRHLIG